MRKKSLLFGLAVFTLTATRLLVQDYAAL